MASVPWRCGQSWKVPGRRHRAQSGTLGRAAPAASPSCASSDGPPAPAQTTSAVSASTGEQVRRAPRRRAAPSRAPTRAAPAAADERVEVGGLPAPARLRTPRSAPRPVQGASTSTRSNDPGGHGGRVPSARPRAEHAVGAGRAHGVPARRGAAAARWRAARRRARRPARRAARPCRPGPAHRSSQRSSAPVERGAASARATSWEPSSWTPARPSATAATAPGSPTARCDAVRRPAAVGSAGQLLDGSSARDGPPG